MSKAAAKAKPEEEEGETRIARGVGDNSGAVVDGKKLSGFITSISRLEDKKQQVLQNIRQDYASAKSLGLDTKTIRRLVREGRMEPEELKAQQDLYDVYKSALGLLDD